MIDALDRTIEQLLHHELDLKAAKIDVQFHPPDEKSAGQGGNLALNFFLYDVRENPVLRRHQWQQLDQGPDDARRSTVQFKRTPLMLDCFYMVTAWSRAETWERPFEEHKWLSRTIKALARYPVLNPPFTERKRTEVLTRINGGEANGKGADKAPAKEAETVAVEAVVSGRKYGLEEWQRRQWIGDPQRNPLIAVPIEVRTRLAQHDVLTNPAEVWSSLTMPMKVGFSYVVTLPLDPWESTAQEGAMVGTGTFVFRQTDGGAQAAGTFSHLGGQVVYPTRNDAPASDVQVVVMNTELYSGAVTVGVFQRRLTDKAGHFVFGGLPPGAYKVLVGPALDSPLAIQDVVLADEPLRADSERTATPLRISIDDPEATQKGT
jgi:hypothetical protein